MTSVVCPFLKKKEDTKTQQLRSIWNHQNFAAPLWKLNDYFKKLYLFFGVPVIFISLGICGWVFVNVWVTELNPESAGFPDRGPFVSDCKLWLSLFLSHTHAWRTFGCCLLPSHSSPLLQAKWVIVYRPFTLLSYHPSLTPLFPFNHNPCMWWPRIRAGLALPPWAVLWVSCCRSLDNLTTAGCRALQNFVPWTRFKSQQDHLSQRGIIHFIKTNKYKSQNWNCDKALEKMGKFQL